jgi:2-polyprenyl-6-methoxyphenol hydroxylase-like FAD-dependent oxidoreductase
MYDVIIVGARVAGASTAMLLARRGLKVLVVDRATFPSDTLSTHQVQLSGVARLARWGVLDAVLAAGTPLTRDVRFDQGDAVITGRYPAYQGVEGMCSPRRTLLDRVLVDAARAAGAEVRGNFAVEEILGDGPVTGICGREKGALAVTEQARLVIGAGGKHSLVATAVDARAYRARPPRSMAFYTYWADVPAGGGSPAGTGEIYGRPGYVAAAWPTNDGLLMTHLARDRAARPMYDFTARLAAISPPTSAEMALFRALVRRQEDADMFLGVLAGSVPLRQFMSPRTMVRLVGVGGFARLAFGQARPQRPGPHVPAQPGRLEKTAGRAPAD